MDGDESGLTSYYHHHHSQQHQQQQPHHSTTTTSNTNGVFSDPQHHHPHPHHPHQNHSTPPTLHYSSSEQTPLSFPQHSVPTRAPPPPPPPPSQPLTSSTTTSPPPEAVKRKRGRPRKYGTPETSSQTGSVSSSKNLPSSSPSLPLPSSSPPRKKDSSFVSSSKKNQLFALGNAGQNFIPHIITVTAGEDVTQRIMSFTQQRKRAVCILSASGSISNASIRQPATLGGNVTYEGRFEILSLSGSFLHTETEGGSSRTGGLSVCLSATDGRIIGGGVGGPLKAAGPVQVIIGSFVIDTNKESNADPKVETSSGKLPQVIGATFSNVDYRTLDSSVRTAGRGNNDHQHIAVNNFMLQSRGMHSMPSHPTDWRDGPSFTDHGACQSSEEGDDGNLHH